MSATEVIAIEDDDEEDVEVVYADPRPLTKVQQIKQQIDLLQAFCKSSEPIPLEYNQFYKCAKKVRPSFSDPTILAAWKRALVNQVKETIPRCKRNISSLKNQPVNISPIVDLTEANTENRCSTSLEQSTHRSSEYSITRPDAVPVALFANPNYSLQEDAEPITSCNGPQSKLNIDETLVNKLEDVTNCLVKIVNDSLEYSEGSDKCCISEEESDSDSRSNEILGAESCVFNDTKSKKNDRRYSEASSQCNGFDDQSLNDTGEESFDCNQTKNRQIKRKSICKNQSRSRKKMKVKNSVSMTDAELKLFREEQRRLKLREKKDLLSIQLERVHDRLVDVLIPKFFTSSSKINSSNIWI